MKKLLLVLLSLSSIAIFSNEITKVGVVDISRVYTRYIKESKGARQIDEIIADYEDEIAKRRVEIDQLNRDLIKAVDDDNNELKEKLESEISIKKTNLQNFQIYKKKEINLLITSDASKREFADKLADVIQRIAMEKGYSLIYKKGDSSVYWYSPDIDITDLVIQGMTN